jgi:DNA-binding MarR family transcriptional regulator
LSDIVKSLAVSKQAGGQLVDTLVQRGYLERATDSEDRRRFTVTLSERGVAAAAAVRSAVGQVDAELKKRIGAEVIGATRRALHALSRIASTTGD